MRLAGEGAQGTCQDSDSDAPGGFFPSGASSSGVRILKQFLRRKYFQIRDALLV
jgi:hypothetical protein